jgi:hypothetical protein
LIFDWGTGISWMSRSESGSKTGSDAFQQVGGEAFEVEWPEGERDEEPVVNVPDEAGVAGGGDFGFEGMKLLEERRAVGGAAESEGGQVFEVVLQVAEHQAGILTQRGKECKGAESQYAPATSISILKKAPGRCWNSQARTPARTPALRRAGASARRNVLRSAGSRPDGKGENGDNREGEKLM